MTRIPFLDLLASSASANADIESAIDRVRRSGWYLRGPEVARLESVWAERCGVLGAVAVGSGTDALRLALSASGVSSDDEVILPAFGSPYTALAVRGAGAVPVFADIDPTTHSLSVASVRESIGPRTRAILPVHLFGRRASSNELSLLAEKHGATVVEDAAQAHGLAGLASARVSAFSFYPTKNLGAMGDAGCLVSNDAELLGRARTLREGGTSEALRGAVASGVSRLDEIQAAILLAKLPHLTPWNERRRALGERYSRGLSDVPNVRLPLPAGPEAHVWHLYVIEHPERDRLIRELESEGIELRVHYEHALHQQPLFRGNGSTRSLPHAERAARRVVSLPLHPGLSEADVDRVIDAVRRHA
jgi:dTDP-3-amino-3,4,6-trideoxy-alpha-D-glucose transaminase